jgi:hypothetical protein
MKNLMLFGVGLLCAATVTPALALISLARMTPQNLAERGFTFAAQQRKDGDVAVRIIRDTTKELSQRRFATLEFPSEPGASAQPEAKVEGKREGKQIIYRFRLSPERFRQTHFRVQEGGGAARGAIFDFPLADFEDLVRRK